MVVAAARQGLELPQRTLLGGAAVFEVDEKEDSAPYFSQLMLYVAPRFRSRQAPRREARLASSTSRP